MAPIKRWFPVSHDINSDPEVWAMRHQIGEKSLSVWLEFLSIADRNDGCLPGDSEELVRSVSGKCQAAQRTVRAVYDFALSRVWLKCDPTLRVSNHAKYHRTRVTNQAPSEPSEPSEPNLKEEDTQERAVKTALVPVLSVRSFVEDWNREFKGQLPAVEWPLSPSRHRKAALRLKEHPNDDWWSEVFTKIGASKFLLGGGSRGWKCTFDFLIANDANCQRIFEGGYNAQKQESRAAIRH